eukprot:snap_masked-scaffold_19-processed-gene-6.36-mRNA-1 protein AED:0.04 eAED:1.00 QI:0/-1/0/1/-1/1/1/0/649
MQQKIFFVLSLPALSISRLATANFYNSGVDGSITFSQDSADTNVAVSVALNGLQNVYNKNAGLSGWHVHQYPVSTNGVTFNSAQSGCGPDFTGGHYNPNGVDLENYLCATEDHSLCEAGDLSGKFGFLDGLASLEEEFTDNDPNVSLTLFGEDSIVGRAIVLHEAGSGARFACANIEPVLTADVNVQQIPVYIEEEDVKGVVKFNKIPDEQGDVYTMFVNIDVKDEPFQFSPQLVSSCEGDDVLFNGPSISSSRGFYTLTDFPGFDVEPSEQSDLYLRIGDSCVQAGKTLVAEFEPSRISDIKGTVSMHQLGKNFPVKVSLDLKNLDSKVSGYHIHDYPVLGSVDSPDCSPEATGGHWNHLGVIYSEEVVCSAETPQQCEAGDLSGRLGNLAGLSEINEELIDDGADLQLFGLNSVFGRSVVIHEPDGARFVCSNITVSGLSINSVKGIMGGTESGTGVGEFDGFSTSIEIKQIDVDSESDSAMYVATDAEGDIQSLAHNWHVHTVRLVEGFDCATTSGHYNPDLLNGGEGANSDGDLEYRCSPDNFGECELGDLAEKFEPIDLEQNGRAVYNDPNLPLSGDQSIVERAIVFHAENRGSARVACGNLVNQPAERVRDVAEERDRDFLVYILPILALIIVVELVVLCTMR